MVRRRAKAVGITTQVCNHTFRGTGITSEEIEPRLEAWAAVGLEDCADNADRGGLERTRRLRIAFGRDGAT
jgi:hypothetical protein